jgi:hypothetical protein
MALASYHDFFTAAATVAGALIGLLFVAISVSPGKITGDHASPEHRATAGVAFTALVNTLVFSLVALLPGADLGITVEILAASGLASTVGLSVLLARRAHHGRIRRFSQVMLMLPVFALYGLQLANGIAMAASPGSTGRVGNQGGLAIVFFVYAIARAWQLVGAHDPGLALTLSGLARGLADRNLLTEDDPAAAAAPAPAPARGPEPPAAPEGSAGPPQPPAPRR